MADNRLIAKNAVFLYMRMAFVMIVSIYVSRIVLAQLGEVDYGIYNVIGGVVAMIMSVNSALSFGTQRFISFYLGKSVPDILTKVFSTSLWIHFVLAVLIVIILEIAGIWFVNNVLTIPYDRLYAANIILHISVFATFFVIIQVPFSAMIIAHERMNVYAYIALSDCAMKLIIAYELSVVHLDKLIFYAVLMALVQIIQMAIYASYSLKKFDECRIVVCKDKKMYSEMLKYSGWNVLGTVGFMTSDQGLNMLLNVFFGPVVNAARAIAMQINNAVRQFVMNLQTAFNPQLVKNYAAGDSDGMLRLLYTNIKYSLLLMWFILLPVFCELDFILDIWLVEVPEYTAIFARLIMLRLLFVCFEQPFITVNGATGYNKVFVIASSIFLFSVLPLSYFSLVIYNQPYIVFAIDLLVYFIMICWKVYYLKGQVGLSPYQLYKRSIQPVLLIMCGSTVVVFPLLSFLSPSFIRFIVVLVIASVVNIVLIWNFALGENIKQKCKEKFSF